MQEKNHRRKVFSVVLGICLFAAPRAGSAAQTSQEIEKGKEVAGQACVQCHSMRYVQLQRRSAERWKNTVYAMISTGALVLPEEIEPLTAYLAADFGPSSPPPALSGQSSGGSRSAARTLEQQLPEGKGKSILLSNCQQCHGLETSIGQSKSQAEWKQIISRMVAAGTVLNQAEQQVLAEYLSGLPPSRSKP